MQNCIRFVGCGDCVFCFVQERFDVLGSRQMATCYVRGETIGARKGGCKCSDDSTVNAGLTHIFGMCVCVCVCVCVNVLVWCEYNVLA